VSFLMLFAVSFAAATIFPFSSEATLYYWFARGENPALLLLAAGSGNTLGALLNYWIGRKGSDWLLERRKISREKLERYEKIFDRRGGWSLWLSWAPVIGDPLTLIAGVMHYHPGKFLLIVALAKFGRYFLILCFG